MKVRVHVNGLNLEQHVAYLSEKCGVTMNNILRKDSKNWQFDTNTQFCTIVVDYFNEKCYNNITVENIGYSKVVAGAKKHLPVAICLVLAFVALVVNSLFVWRIEIDGYDRQCVVDVLNEMGVHRGSLVSSINYDEIENHLSSTFNQMYTIVTIKGNSLSVQLLDKKLPLPLIDYDKKHDVVATESGIVSSLSVIQGTALVTVGQSVSKGETLIAGVRTFNDGTTEPTYALGEVVLTKTVTGSANYTGKVSLWQASGESQVTTTVFIGQLQIEKVKCNYEHYDVTYSYNYLNPLNICIRYNYYCEKQLISKSVTFQQDEKRLKQCALAAVVIDDNWQIETVEYLVNDNTVTAKVTQSTVIN